MTTATRLTSRVTSTIFRRIFRASKTSAEQVAAQLNAAVHSVSKLGITKIIEFLVALPIFFKFVRELIRHSAEIESKKKLIILGSAAAVSTLGLTALGTVLGSLVGQLFLLVTHPWLAILLFFGGGVIIPAIIVVLVWLIIYVLNNAFADDPSYQRIRDEFLPQSDQDLIAKIQIEIERDVSGIEELREVVETLLMKRGAKADAKELQKKLRRVEKDAARKAVGQLKRWQRKADRAK
jgi:hypothetical protein